MKQFIAAILFFIIALNSSGAHIKGGFISYQYLGPGINNTNNVRYRITLTVYMACYPNAQQLSSPIFITIYNGNGSTQIANPAVNLTDRYELGRATDEPCITGDQSGCYYTIVVYELNSYELPATADGYIIAYQRCCRIDGMDNVVNSGAVGNSYQIKIPGTGSAVPNANQNSSPVFQVNDIAVVCGGSFFSFDLAARDPDGDQLRYTLCSANEGGSSNEPVPNPSPPPPYNSVNYLGGYNGSNPMGNGVTIDPITGLLSGIAPPIVNTGEYVVTVCVTEYRNGIALAESRKELHIRVRDCVPVAATLRPRPVTCDGFNVNFSNEGVLQTGTTYEWEFGDPNSGTLNTSTLATPSHLYTDTGVFIVRLRVSLSGLCADTASTVVRVYPGFFPAFNVDPPFCKGVPIQFSDQTTTRYGIPTGWRWNFGDNAVLNDSSNAKTPNYTFNNAGVYTAKLIVSNTFGCTDSTTRTITIQENPELLLRPRDTTYCSLDSVILSANGVGSFRWTPTTNMIGANTSGPIVFPAVPTTYYVSLTSNGCTSNDSVRVTPVNNVTASITASATTICEQDTITLTGNSNYLNNITWSWAPAASVTTNNGKVTRAYPAGNTTYTLGVRWGKSCTASANQTITVRPLAVPEAGPNQAICKGQQTASLQASGGNSYRWTPATGLSNPNIANPVASPSTTTVYKVAVGIAGCTATKTDSVTVLVRELPDARLVDDTLICSIDTLRLLTNPAAAYTWSPDYMINNLTAASPLVSPDVPTTYYATLTDQFGCVNSDSVFVDVKLFVTIDAGSDTAICRTDTVRLRTVSDALSYQWTPSLTLDNDRAKNPVATPVDSFTTYRVVGNIGKCQSRDSVTIRTVPYPVATINQPAGICYGKSSNLLAGGGSGYNWTPSTFLSATNVPGPVVSNATRSIYYLVSVTDTFGCPKADTIGTFLTVRPRVLARTGIRDTSIVIGQTVRMNASGGDIYSWSPATWLSSSNAPAPLASPQSTITYTVTVTQLPENCIGLDSVRITVFQLPPSFYVPTAFSPNGDDKNDILRPKALGMKSIRYFKVYNRLGVLVFETTEMNRGWDGTYRGNPQDPAAYVWIAQGETFTGELITRQGNAVLIR